MTFLTEDVQQCFVGLDLLDQIIPTTDGKLLPPGALRFSGELTAKQRKDHSKKNGTAWLTTGQIELMHALIFRDGRYDNSVFVMRMSFMSYVHNGYITQNRVTSMLKMKEGLPADMVEAVLEKYISNKFGMSSSEILKSWDLAMKELQSKVIHAFPNLLQKKMLVFPINDDDVHWKCVYVFNPSSIDINLDDEQTPTPRACFYQYCGMDASGRTVIKSENAVLWFLNLLYSYDVFYRNHPGQKPSQQPVEVIDGDSKVSGSGDERQSKQNPPQVQFLTPFGAHDPDKSKMIGSFQFPSLRLERRCCLCNRCIVEDHRWRR